MADNDKKRLLLEEKERELSDRQRQFELRMKEQQEKFTKEKKTNDIQI